VFIHPVTAKDVNVLRRCVPEQLPAQRCRSHVEQLSSTDSSWLPLFATLQYEVIRSLHERGDDQLVVSEASDLLCFLAERCAEADVAAVQTNCLIAVVSSCARGLLKLEQAERQQVYRHVRETVEHNPTQAAQLARNLVLGEIRTATHHGTPLDHEAVHDLVTVIEACMPSDSDVARKLVTQLVRAVPASTITSLLNRSRPLSYHEVHIKAIMSDYVRRSADEFASKVDNDPLHATALLAQLARALIPGHPSPAPTRPQLTSVSQCLSTLTADESDEILALCCESSLISVTDSLHEAVKVSQRSGGPKPSSKEQFKAVEVLLKACCSFSAMSAETGNEAASKHAAADALSYILHCCAGALPRSSLCLPCACYPWHPF
jgi:hypothetical protein